MKTCVMPCRSDHVIRVRLGGLTVKVRRTFDLNKAFTDLCVLVEVVHT